MYEDNKPAILDIATANFRTDMIDTTINSMAHPVLWEKSYLCPCRDRATRQPDQSCTRCHGRGIAYLPAKEINLIVQSQEKGILNADLGLIDAGTAIGTTDRPTQVAFRDRISLPISRISQSFIFDVSQRRINNGFFMVYNVHEIEYATTIDKDLSEGTDYEVDLNRNLFFPKQHLLGKNISINIQTTLRYMVADLLKEHRYGRNTMRQLIKLPQKLLLKREDLFVDKESFEIGTEDNMTGQMIETKRQPSVEGLNGFFGSGL